jgi:hypothetical protein
MCHGKFDDNAESNTPDCKPPARLNGIPALRLKLKNELAIMPETYAAQWPHVPHTEFKFDAMEWVSRWGEGYLANDRCSPRGMASIRSKRG